MKAFPVHSSLNYVIHGSQYFVFSANMADYETLKQCSLTRHMMTYDINGSCAFKAVTVVFPSRMTMVFGI